MPASARASLSRFPIGLALGLFGSLAACSPPPYSPDSSAGTDPSIRITWPLPESTVTGCAIVTVEVQHLTLADWTVHTSEVPPDGDTPGEGHYHVFTPVGYVSSFAPFALSAFTDIPEANDSMRVQLVSNIHQALLDGNGDTIEDSIPLHYLPGDCVEFNPSDSVPDSSDVHSGG